MITMERYFEYAEEQSNDLEAIKRAKEEYEAFIMLTHHQGDNMSSSA